MYKVIALFIGYLQLVSGGFNVREGIPGGRIVGGVTTTIEKHPWQVSLQVFGNHICGGSIISSGLILTAAHCVTELIVTVYYVVPGVTDLRQAEQKYQVEEAIMHDDYDSVTYDYDIALLKLQENLTFSNTIQAISLPNELFTIPDGTSLVASGWGITEPDGTDSSDVLREIEIQYINWETCRTRLSSVGTFTERMICAGVPEGGKDTCQSDSGGALELNSTLIGIVSWGEGCGDPRYPGVYTHVSYLRAWIREHTGI
ncbi:trypsin-3 [Anoplophora glabripennis]|nr:trypsin-3 [Anoplophora glabripennis]